MQQRLLRGPFDTLVSFCETFAAALFSGCSPARPSLSRDGSCLPLYLNKPAFGVGKSLEPIPSFFFNERRRRGFNRSFSFVHIPMPARISWYHRFPILGIFFRGTSSICLPATMRVGGQDPVSFDPSCGSIFLCLNFPFASQKRGANRMSPLFFF